MEGAWWVGEYASIWRRGMKIACGERRFQNTREWKVGDGHLIRFGEDYWLEEENLPSLFPILFNNSLIQRKCIANMGWW